MKNVVFLVALLLGSIAACDMPGEMGGAKSPEPTASESSSSGGENKYAKEKEEEPVTPELEAKAAKVQVLQNADKLGCATEVIGLVDVHEPVKTEYEALHELRLDGARLNAEAVIGVEFHHGEPGEEPTHLSGVAVRCHDLIKGRAYDVLGPVEVSQKMGDEDALYKAMRVKAKSMGADVVLDVKFDHGEGGEEPIKMTGTAIRFKQ